MRVGLGQFSVLVAVISVLLLFSSVSYGGAAVLGAQVWIEPGQTQEQIEGWFKTLADNQMPLARLFIMWNYVEPEPGVWDFSLYDMAFDAAQKYGVKIVATLTTNRRAVHRGDFYQLHAAKLEDTRGRLEESKIYIRKVVGHWKGHPALDGWSSTNEAGQQPATHPIAIERFKVWLAGRYSSIEELNKVWSTNFSDFESIEVHRAWSTGRAYWYWPGPFVDWYTFWREHLAWWLEWISSEIRLADPGHPVHSHAVGQIANMAGYSQDLPKWRVFSDSMGATFHPSWGMGNFGRDQLALGIGWGCELMRGCSEPKPFWMTELQGGTNIYSGGENAMTPTENDIAQWVWTGVASGTERVIFWMLNSRLGGFEAGEWSMLDYQNRPTERLVEAGKIAKVINDHGSFFAEAVPIKTPVTIILSLETETLGAWRPSRDFAGRGSDAHVLSASAYYEILSELGVPVRIKFIHDFDWTAKGGDKQLVILAHVTSLSSQQMSDIKEFAAHGNTVLISGLTGMYDEYMNSWVMRGSPMDEMLGARLKNVRLVDRYCEVSLQEPKVVLPSHLWVGEIENISAEVIGRQGGWVTAVSNNFGKGRAIWVPSTVGLGAWEKDNRPLAEFVKKIAEPFVSEIPFRFADQYKNCLLRVMKSGDKYLTVVTNGSAENRECVLKGPKDMKGEVLWGDVAKFSAKRRKCKLGPRETMVLLWSKK